MRHDRHNWQACLVATFTIAVCSLADTKVAAQFGGGFGGGSPTRDYDEAIAFSSDGAIVGGGGLDKLRFWDARTGKLLRTVALPKPWVHSVAFAPQSSMLYAACGDGQIYTCDADSGELKLAIAIDAASIKEIAFSPDGKFLACTVEEHADADLKFETFRLWDVSRQTFLRPLFREGDTYLLGLKYSPDGKTLAVGVNVGRPRHGAIRV